jgi:hypothetical protein
LFNPNGTVTVANPFGTTGTFDAQASGFTIDALSNVTVTNAGTYLVATRVTGTVITGAQAFPVVAGLAMAQINKTVLASQLECTYFYTITTTLAGVVIPFANLFTATTITSATTAFGGMSPANSYA